MLPTRCPATGWVMDRVGCAERRRAAARNAEPVNDSWIAACCLSHDVPLATLNTKDFADFVQHDGLRQL